MVFARLRELQSPRGEGAAPPAPLASTPNLPIKIVVMMKNSMGLMWWNSDNNVSNGEAYLPKNRRSYGETRVD